MSFLALIFAALPVPPAWHPREESVQNQDELNQLIAQLTQMFQEWRARRTAPEPEPEEEWEEYITILWDPTPQTLPHKQARPVPALKTPKLRRTFSLILQSWNRALIVPFT